MKFYYARGTCSIGIHIVLEEIGVPYEAVAVDFRNAAQYQPEYVAVSPKSRVPAIVRDDGTTLTEYGAIATWLAMTNPAANLLSPDVERRVRMIEAMDYCVATLHMRGFTRMVRPGVFAPSEADHDAVKAQGREIMTNGLAILGANLGDKDYVAGDYSIGDSALFYVVNWAARTGIQLPTNLATHYERMKARPAVQRALAAEKA
jgi:glutathione S-transferase